MAVTVNNDDNEADFRIPVDSSETYIGTLTGAKVQPENGQIHVSVKGNFGEIWVPASALNEEPVTVPAETSMPEEKIVKDTVEQAEENIADTAVAKETSATEPVSEIPQEVPAEASTPATPDVFDIPEKKDEKVLDLNKPYEEMSVEELQAAILEKLSKNGPVTDQMRRDVAENVYLNSLLNWVKSFQ